MSTPIKQEVIAIFDIGKTNKKFFLFDTNYNEVYKEYTTLEEIVDEDGFPTEDIHALQKWIQLVFKNILDSNTYTITAVNFSTYGASLVHLDKNGDLLTPLYNYLKPIPSDILEQFNNTYGDISIETGAPPSGMLNSGMQLYWLKYKQPDVFKNISYSLHLPQYLSYMFTGVPLSEFTSIGCHTSLWDYGKKDYHSWVYKEDIDQILPPIVSTETCISKYYNGKRIKIGVGIHDSSSALIPYLKGSKKPFVLVSTGTWSVSLNPYSDVSLTNEALQNDTINYMKVNGKPVKSAKLLLGKEYIHQITQLSQYFDVPLDQHKSVAFNSQIFDRLSHNFDPCFKWKYIDNTETPEKTNLKFDNYQDAYHQLMIELIDLQIQSIKTTLGTNSSIKRLYIDGGFSDNDVFIKLLTHRLRNLKVRSTCSSLGSALGAAIVIMDGKLDSNFLKKNYGLKKHIPFILR
ncbi:FGGY-family carbohydrate kinase [Winogradskyella sediminis]|uniref:FGGY-family carbohydrate kinase n=1 Tax=Winogradskyella sediminis TaxID=1382466 RepID=UPI000E389EF4|nr:FGGY family carbohydrate kinase [Winogradskyella sediminis]REG89453.1 sugar (pentulose or hexulose) kinase [Winogradskyella sediminis]